MCFTLYLRHLSDNAIHYNLAAYATLINFHRLFWILCTCCDIIVIIISEKAVVNAFENSYVF